MADLLRVSIMGQMPTGEEWSVNPCFKLASPGTTVSTDAAQTVATAIAAVAVHTALRNCMNTTTTATDVRVEARTAAGALESQAQATRPTAVSGTGSQAHPFQTAVVCSLRTAAVGGSGRGRIYWPGTGQVIAASTLRISTADLTSILSGFQSYLTSVRNAIATTFTGVQLAVWSRKNSSLANVSSIQVGDVLDTQRRRRDTLVETYQSTLFV